MMDRAIIGRVAATKMQGNNSREFYFWVEPETRINPLDLIVVKEENKGSTRRVYAQILDITSHTDAESFLEIFASTDFGNVQITSDVDRVAFSVAKAQVLGTSDNVHMPVQFNEPVYLADSAAILELLKVDELDDKYMLPIGYIEQSNDVKVPVPMDVRWLTGPDGAHLNVSGKTRLAAKTSYLLFLVSALLQKQSDTAVILFNVKGSDLLQIHEPNRLLAKEQTSLMLDDATEQLLQELKGGWEAMGLEAKPFDKNKVFYFLPSQKNNSALINADLRNLPASSPQITDQPGNYFVYRYTLQAVKGRLQLLLSSQNPNDTQLQFIAALDSNENSFAWTEDSFAGLCSKLQPLSAGGGPNRVAPVYLDAYPGTIGVVKRYIETVSNNRTTGVFDYDRSSFASGRFKLPSNFIENSLEAGQLVVVDIARTNDFEKQWVFGDVLKSVERLMFAGGREGLRKVIVIVDELNKYAPAGTSSPLINDIVDITARGGSLGVILFGAEQFASRINAQVYGNCANKVFGLTDATESGTEPYRSFPKEIKDRLGELQRGELVASLDFFGQPLRIKFPRPVCRKQEDAS